RRPGRERRARPRGALRRGRASRRRSRLPLALPHGPRSARCRLPRRKRRCARAGLYHVLAPAPHPVLSREKVKRPHGGPILSALVLLATVVACGGSKKPPEPVAITRSVSSKCPDLAKADELGAFDFAKEYALSKDAAEKLKAAALAALEVSNLNDKLDAELGIACSQIAHDLGDKGDWRNGNDACAAAIKDVREARAKLGAKVN